MASNKFEKMAVRSAQLFQSRHGRIPTEDDTDRSCVPQNQAEQDFLLEMDDEDFGCMVLLWGDHDDSIGEFMAQSGDYLVRG